MIPCNPQVFYKHAAPCLFFFPPQSLCISLSQAQHFGWFLMEFHLNIWESFLQAVKIVSNSDPGLLGLAASPNCVIHRLGLFACCSVVNKNYLLELSIRQTAEWPTWNILPDSDPALAVAAERFFNRLCTYAIVIISIPYSLACHIHQRVLLKIKHYCICRFLFIH